MDEFSKLLELFKTYGAPFVLLWAMVETDLVFLVIGALAHKGYINFYSCLPAAILGAMVHDTFVFWLSRNRASWVRSRKAYHKLSTAVERFANKTGPWQLALCRPLYGTRYPTIIFWGLQNLSYPRFLTFGSIGLVPWAALLTAIGFALSNQLDQFDDWLGEAKNWIFGAVILVALIIFIRKRFFQKAPPQTVINQSGEETTPPPSARNVSQ
jgi:membrane protein DedA with SNARE-associated domain